jgi:aminopeptidase N
MRFRKAGTDDFRAAMEAASGQPLERFFERWIYGATLPRVKFSYSVQGSDAVLHVEQLTDEVFDFPLVVSVQCADRKPIDVIVPVTERTVEKRVPLAGTLRSVDVSKDTATMVEVVR